jgi:hypothetical protein
MNRSMSSSSRTVAVQLWKPRTAYCSGTYSDFHGLRESVGSSTISKSMPACTTRKYLSPKRSDSCTTVTPFLPKCSQALGDDRTFPLVYSGTYKVHQRVADTFVKGRHCACRPRRAHLQPDWRLRAKRRRARRVQPRRELANGVAPIQDVKNLECRGDLPDCYRAPMTVNNLGRHAEGLLLAEPGTSSSVDGSLPTHR